MSSSDYHLGYYEGAPLCFDTTHPVRVTALPLPICLSFCPRFVMRVQREAIPLC